jgi:hypothetical protein
VAGARTRRQPGRGAGQGRSAQGAGGMDAGRMPPRRPRRACHAPGSARWT